MIHIVTGNIEAGKTRGVVRIHAELGRGDGFIAERFFLNKECHGYRLRRLTEKEGRPWMIKKEDVDDPSLYDASFGPFRYARKTLRQAEHELKKMLEEKVTPIFLDEIGRLELTGGGWAHILRKLLASGTELYLTIRTPFIKDVIKEFKITSYVIEGPGDEKDA